MELAFDLYELAVQMIAQRVRREKPEATSEDVATEIGRWHRKQAGSLGDEWDHPNFRFGEPIV